MLDRIAWGLVGALTLAGPASAEIHVFDDRDAFLAATQADPVEPFPNLGMVATPFVWGERGELSIGLGEDTVALFVGTGLANWSWTSLIEGNALAIIGMSNLNVDLSEPAYSVGFELVEPMEADVHGPFVDSVFRVTLLQGTDAVASFTHDPPVDVLTFLGVWSSKPFDRIEIVEIVGDDGNEYFGQFFLGQTALVSEPTELEVEVDVRPGSAATPLNPNASGVVPVAVLGGPAVDATAIDPSTVTLAGAPIRQVGPDGRLLARVVDVNNDGMLDLLFHVDLRELDLEPGQSTVELRAVTFDGAALRGEASVRVVADPGGNPGRGGNPHHRARSR